MTPFCHTNFHYDDICILLKMDNIPLESAILNYGNSAPLGSYHKINPLFPLWFFHFFSPLFSYYILSIEIPMYKQRDQ